LQLLEPLSNLLSSRLQGTADLPDLVIPVPLHPLRLRERGFNQSLEIARFVANKLQLETDWQSVKRIHHTPPQTDLSEKERRRNLQGAFSISGDLRGRHVALLDDVITTGATLTELSRLLMRQGVERVDLWALARTPMHSG
jgi:ComF family protein